MPSWAMTRAGWPILVTFNRLVLSATGRAKRRSRILSTERLEAPHTRTLFGLGFAGVSVVSCRIISMSVCVLPVPLLEVIDNRCLHESLERTWWSMYARYFWGFQTKSNRRLLTVVQRVVKEIQLVDSIFRGWRPHSKKNLEQSGQLSSLSVL